MSSNSHANHFEFITGFRGLCTLWVVVANSNWKQDLKTSEVLLFVGYTKQTFAVNCLFLLNAFLLTYRLATDLNQSNFKYSVSMFLMRRTIRIYFAYVLFCTFITLHMPQDKKFVLFYTFLYFSVLFYILLYFSVLL